MKSFIKSFLLIGLLLGSVGCRKKVDSTKGDDLSGQVVIYNTTPEWLVDEVIKGFNTKYPDIEIIAPKQGTETVINKLLLENSEDMISADLVWVADPASLTPLINNDILKKYDSPEGEFIPSKYKGPNGYWYSNRVLKMALAYNTNIHSAPSSWMDLVDPKNKGDIALPGVTGAFIYTWEATLIYNEDTFLRGGY